VFVVWFVQVPLNLIGVRAVRPVLLTPESYSQFQIEPTLLRRNLPTQPPVQPLQQQQSAATAEGIYRRYFCYGWLGSRVVSVLDSGAQGHSRDAVR